LASLETGFLGVEGSKFGEKRVNQHKSYLANNQRVQDYLEEVVRQRSSKMGCGTYRVHSLFNSSAVWTSDPENIRTVLATKFRDFELGPVRRNNFVPVLGHGIFTSEGDDWAYFRAQLRPQFTREQVSDLEAAERHLQILFRALPEEDSSS